MDEPDRVLAILTEALEADTRFSIDDLAVSRHADNGTITLKGWVEDIAAKRRAVTTAWRTLNGQHPIKDHLRVRARDEGQLQLRDQVVRNLANEGVFSDCTLTVIAGSHQERLHDGGPGAAEIHVDIDDGVVTLVGNVPSLSHRRFAEVLAWWAPGCQRVDNLLTVRSPDEDDDNDITDVLRMVLEKDPLVDADQIRAGTAGGIVELSGLVTSEEERRLAVTDAWYVPGVWDVVDRIEVRAPGQASQTADRPSA